MIHLIANDIGYVILFALLLFLPAGTVAWPGAWVLLVVLLVCRVTGTVAVAQVNRSLLVERSGVPLHREQPLSDRVLLISFMATFAGVVAFTAVDRFHLYLFPVPPYPLALLGLLLFGMGWGGVALALRANAYAVTVVRHQEDRGQHVVSSGPYAIVRHPMYASLIPVMIGLALWLGSYAAALSAMVPIAILAVRILLEEQLLRRSLPGYTEYAASVRWRLVPGLW